MIKYLLLLFISLPVMANTRVQLGTGSITPHFSNEKKNYCNQWNNTGIIVNKTYYVRAMVERYGFTYMVGNDSICSPIEGIFVHYMFERYENWEIGMLAGGYAYEQNNWDDHARDTPSGIDAPDPVRTKFGGRDVVPVLALEVNFDLVRGDRWAVKVNNMFTPVIFNHSIAFEYAF